VEEFATVLRERERREGEKRRGGKGRGVEPLLPRWKAERIMSVFSGRNCGDQCVFTNHQARAKWLAMDGVRGKTQPLVCCSTTPKRGRAE